MSFLNSTKIVICQPFIERLDSSHRFNGRLGSTACPIGGLGFFHRDRQGGLICNYRNFIVLCKYAP
jgi:hypothetical protein